ncbi:MAG: tRNA1Val (adenine37-N6)-methyltransferase [Thermosediminibacterales bacterium]|nr:tRNA1Val (adenine37-N6)-methyltransferase [Thermosediminibacterales bacterium]
MMDLLKPNERIDDLVCKNLKIIQNPKSYCFSIDAVLLSNFVTVKKGETVVDLGCGTGVISLLLSAKTPAKKIYGIEILDTVADMAERSVKLNGLEHKIEILSMDMKDAPQKLGRGKYDVVVSNPPFREIGTGKINPDPVKACAKHELFVNLEGVISAAGMLLKKGGRFFLIHRTRRLPDIFCYMKKHKIEPKKIKFVHSTFDSPPNMVLIESVKGGNPEMKVLPSLYIYKEKGVYSEQIMSVYGENAERQGLLNSGQ